MTRVPAADLIVSLAVMAAAGFFFAAALELPPATLEPIGPGAFPLWTAGILIVLAGAILVRAFRRPAAPETMREDPESGTAGSGASATGQALALGGLTIAWIAAMEFELAGFRWASTAYAFVVTALLFDWRLSRLPAAAAIAIFLGVGLHYVFTRFFFIDLP